MSGSTSDVAPDGRQHAARHGEQPVHVGLQVAVRRTGRCARPGHGARRRRQLGQQLRGGAVVELAEGKARAGPASRCTPRRARRSVAPPATGRTAAPAGQPPRPTPGLGRRRLSGTAVGSGPAGPRRRPRRQARGPAWRAAGRPGLAASADGSPRPPARPRRGSAEASSSSSRSRVAGQPGQPVAPVGRPRGQGGRLAVARRGRSLRLRMVVCPRRDRRLSERASKLLYFAPCPRGGGQPPGVSARRQDCAPTDIKLQLARARRV
jgi:hypothetical protein